MCVECMAGLPRTYLHRVDFNTLHQRIGGTHEIGVAAGWFHYLPDSPYATLIHEAKYGDRPATARRLGRLYGSELRDDGLAGRFDVLLPVPLHIGRQLSRGYNQSREAAVGMAAELGCEVGDNIVALRGHSTQTRRSGYERYSNVRGTYGVRHADELEGLHIAVIDDIVTPGSTVFDCIDAIMSVAAPAAVNVLSLGVTKMR